jgi:hypothetical protein
LQKTGVPVRASWVRIPTASALDRRPRMANYYPLLANVISALENSSAEVRRRLYESARTGFLEQMSKHDPPLNQSYIKQERIAFEEAIRKVEAEQISRLSSQELVSDTRPPAAQPNAPR